VKQIALCDQEMIPDKEGYKVHPNGGLPIIVDNQRIMLRQVKTALSAEIDKDFLSKAIQ